MAALSRQQWWLAAAVLIVAAALTARLVYVDENPVRRHRGDARDYDRHARSIAAGNGYSRQLAHGRPTAFRPPAYPYFLGGVYWLTGHGGAKPVTRIRTARIANAFLGTLAVALIGVLAWQLGGRLTGLVALGLAAAYVPFITVGGAVMSESLFLVFMLGALVAAVQHRRSSHAYRWIVLAGALAGLAILARPNAVILLLPLAFAARTRGGFAQPAVLVAAALLTVAPWTIRNAIELDTFVPVSTQLGSALAGTYNDAARSDEDNPASWRHIRHVPEYLDEWINIRQVSEPELDRDLRAQARDYMADHPAYVAEVGFWNTVRLLDLASLERSRATAMTISITPDWADTGVVCFWIFAALALAGAFTGLARGAPRFIWAVPGLLALSIVFLVVETPRYRTPIDPFVVLLAAMAIAAPARRYAESVSSRAALSKTSV